MRAVVRGAGIAGSVLAGCLGRRGWDVVVLERAPRPREQGCMTDFFGPGWDAAEAMGVLPAVLELGYTVDRLSCADDRGRDRAGLPFARFAGALDGRLVSVLRPDLERVLREHAREVAERRVVAVRERPVPAGPREALRDVHGPFVCIVPRALAACPGADRLYDDQVGQTEAPRWSVGRVGLLGATGSAVTTKAPDRAVRGLRSVVRPKGFEPPTF